MAQRYLYMGTHRTTREIADMAGVSIYTLRKRLRRGVPVHEAAKARPDPLPKITFKAKANWAKMLRDLREERDLSQREVARASGIGRTMLRSIERGTYTYLSIAYVERLLAVYGYELDAIKREGS